jgi:hypothetical protein
MLLISENVQRTDELALGLARITICCLGRVTGSKAQSLAAKCDGRAQPVTS